MDSLLIQRENVELNGVLGGIIDLLHERYGTRLNALHGLLLRVQALSDTALKVAVVLYVVRRDPALQNYVRANADDRKWNVFQHALVKTTEDVLDGNIRLVDYVQRCTDAWIVA